MIFIANGVWLLLMMLLDEKIRRSRSRFWRRVDALANVILPIGMLVVGVVLLLLLRSGAVQWVKISSWMW